ncbi:MAG: LUD domain-containing protein [Anaerolineales bacterium]
MVDTFHERIRASLSNEDLQIALDANAERRFEARKNAFASLSTDLTIMRAKAKQIRQDVVDHLDQYLEQFVAQADNNGLEIHFAANSLDAVNMVLDIARENDAELIAKSKTMVSEEIGLNHALEAAGLKVVETDLGEYIVQLRGEPPAHIITPAVHLRKEQCGETFHEKLGIPYTDDVATMTAAAREQLREIFLEADIGISGVNFGVAESGTLCLVTNEGNGRMVTSLPRVHIALMGIERLVPKMQDLAVMLELLPRSATGQKMTVYTTLINGPRKPSDADGPEQRHLILVDDGRRAMRESPLAEGLLCIRCGACLNACPVFAEIGGHAYVNERGETSTYPGPIGSIVSPGLFGQVQFGKFARASTLCGACKDACPVDIDLPKLLLRVRAGGVTLNSNEVERSVPFPVYFGLRLYTWMATNPGRFNFALKAVGWISKLVSPSSDWLPLPGFTGWGYSKDLPRPSQRPFRERWSSNNKIGNSPGNNKPLDFGNDSIETEKEKTNNKSDDVIERFAEELRALGGEFYLCTSAELSERVFEQLQDFGVNSILSWDEAYLPSGLTRSLQSKGIQISQDFDPEIKIGLTGSEAGIANTGTLVLSLDQGKPQFVSLIPEIHFAIIRAADIKENLYQVIDASELKEASMSSLISGPSRTADIEMTLTIGVHGPKQVHVFCLSD